MQIGYVKQKEFITRDDNGGKKVNKYFEMSIRPVFGMSAKFTMSKNNSDNENAPAYNLYAHSEKGSISRKQKVGALWIREYEGETFMSGHIETPMMATGKLQISLWRAKSLFENEVVDWIYDVNWKPYNPDTTTSSDGTSTAQPGYEVPDVDIDEDEIPF
jgi:uncharacterized protein (DUF736 family)